MNSPVAGIYFAVNLFGFETDPEVDRYIVPLLTLVCGLAILYILMVLVGRVARHHVSEHAGHILRKAVFYLGSILLLVTVLGELGMDLTALIATAGVATVAVGFAAQTSLSNLISGLFLLSIVFPM